jgi:hypothetical protein
MDSKSAPASLRNAIEKENARLKKLLAERVLENDVLKEALSKNRVPA